MEFLLTRAKYNRSQELFGIEPSSIRVCVCVSASFTKKEIEKIASVIKNVSMSFKK